MEQSPPIKLGFSSIIILAILTINYIGQLSKNHYYYIFANIPLFTVLQLELWRLITGFFTSSSLYEYIFNSFIVITILNYWENKEGTSKHSIILYSNLLIFQSSMLMVYLILVWFFPLTLSFSIKSLPSLGIAFLVKHMLLTNTKTVIVYPNIVLNDRLLVIMFLFGFILLCGLELRIEMMISLYYGFLMCKYAKFYEIEMITEDMINSFENYDKNKGLFKMNCWILYDERYDGMVKETINGLGLNSSSNNDNGNSIGNSIGNVNGNENSEASQPDNTIEIVEEEKVDNTFDDINKEKEDIAHDFVDLSLEDNS